MTGRKCNFKSTQATGWSLSSCFAQTRYVLFFLTDLQSKLIKNMCLELTPETGCTKISRVETICTINTDIESNQTAEIWDVLVLTLFPSDNLA